MISPLRAARIGQKKSLIEVASAVGIDSGNLSRIERGAQVPSKDLAARLAAYFGSTISETEIIYPERYTKSIENSIQSM